jgi:hypothetical protein
VGESTYPAPDRISDVSDDMIDTLAEFERFTVNRVRLTVQQTVNACFVSAERAGLYEEFRNRIERRVREQVATEIEADADVLERQCAKSGAAYFRRAARRARGEAR